MQTNSLEQSQRHEVSHTEQQEGSGKVESHFTTFKAERKTQLGTNGQGPEVELVPINTSGMIESTSNQMLQTDQAESARAGEMIKNDQGEPVETIERQLEKGEVEGQKVLLLSKVFREFGDVYAVKGEVNMSKFGNKINNEGAEFVIPLTRAKEMQSLLHNVTGEWGSGGGSFHIESTHTLDKGEGFEAVYRYTVNGKQQETRLTFFYFDDSKETAQAQKKKPEEPGKKQDHAERETQLTDQEVEDLIAKKRAERASQKAQEKTTQASQPEQPFVPPVAKDSEDDSIVATLHTYQRKVAGSKHVEEDEDVRAVA